MQKRLLIIASLLTSFYAIAQQPANINPTYSKQVEERINRVENGLRGEAGMADSVAWNLAERMRFHNINGVSIAVIHNYSLEWARGYGWADTLDHRAVTALTLFQAASISKSLNAMGVLKLADNKKIKLDTTINAYLTSWKFPESSYTKRNKVTVTQLLSHTAGLGVHGFPGYSWTDNIPTDNQILDGQAPANTAAIRSVMKPGKKVVYSGGGTTITKKIIMDVTGFAYDLYMWKQVMEPIGMSASFYTQPPPPGAFPVLATAYYANGKPVKGNFHIYPEQAPDGLWTNPSDLARFIIELQLSLQGRSNKVLSQAMANTMVTPYLENAALGVFIDTRGNEKYFQHGGANEGFRCQYYGSLQNGNGVVVMVNSDNGAILNEIIRSVANEYQWKDFFAPAKKR